MGSHSNFSARRQTENRPQHESPHSTEQNADRKSPTQNAGTEGPKAGAGKEKQNKNKRTKTTQEHKTQHTNQTIRVMTCLKLYHPRNRTRNMMANTIRKEEG